MRKLPLWICGILFLITACGGQEPENTPPPSEQYLGIKYELDSYIAEDGTVTRYVRGAVTMEFDTADHISGNILCNFYRAELKWERSTAQVMLVDTTKNDCGQTTEFAIPARFNINFIGRRLTMTSENPRFTANFRSY